MQQKHHLCIDGYDGSSPALRNEVVLETYFRDVDPAALTHLLYFPDESNLGMEGVTGCLLAPGMHTTVHTYTNDRKKCYFFDFFGFEEDLHRKNVLHLKNAFQGTYHMEHEILRSQREVRFGVPDASNTRVYGPHLMAEIAIKEADRALVADNIKTFLQDLPEVIDMNALTGVFQVESQEWISALRVIAESHISVHYHVATRTMFLDVFSCKPFDCEKAVALLQQRFQIETSQQRIWERGVYFHRS